MGVENGMFRSEIGSGFEDPGGTPPPRIPRSTPPGTFTGIFGVMGTPGLYHPGVSS